MPEHVVSRYEMEALLTLQSISKPSDVIVVDPRQFASDPIYVSALSQRRLYLGSSDYIKQTGNDPSERFAIIKNIFDAKTVDAKTVKVPGNYLYVLKPHPNHNLWVNLDTAGFSIVYENSAVIVLQNKGII